MMTVIRERTAPSVRFTSAPMVHRPRKRQQQDSDEENESGCWCLCIWDTNTKYCMYEEWCIADATIFMVLMMSADEKYKKNCEKPCYASTIMWCRCLPTDAEYSAIRYRMSYVQYEYCLYCPETAKRKSVQGITVRNKEAMTYLLRI